MSWLTYDPATAWPDFARFPPLSRRQALLHQSYVSPKARGVGLQRSMDVRRKGFLKAEGYDTAVVCIGVKNFASIHNLMATNFKYKLFYHLSLDIPLFGKANFYPKWESEPWVLCEVNASRWDPCTSRTEKEVQE